MKLFEPGKIGNIELRNRIVMAPMGMGRMDEPDGNWGERVHEYFLARARGGAGMITTCGIMVTQKLEPFTSHHFNINSDKHLESLQKMATGIHKHGAKVSVQLSGGLGRVLPKFLKDLAPDPNTPPISSSPGPYLYEPSIMCRALRLEEVEEIAQAFGTAAKRCQMAGADVVEMNGHNGYILDQFMSAIWNRRTDKYGGSREKRLTLAREIIGAIRKSTGGHMPVIYRMGMDHHVEGGRTLEESLLITKELEAMGYDALHLDAGAHETAWYGHPTTYQPRGCLVYLAARTKSVVSIPVIAVGKLHYPDLAEKVLQEGEADFIALGRGLLADPDWPNKVREDRLDDLVLCITDSEGCSGELYKGRAVSCTVNPACGHEKEWTLTRVKHKKRLLVVGGGPAGMEAARLGALRGMDVLLWEKGDRLGGNLRAAGAPSCKKDLLDYMEYQITQIRKLKVDVKLNTEAIVKEVLGQDANLVVLATGAVPQQLDLPGVEAKHVVTAIDLLLGKKHSGEKAVVVGGGLIGCETALHLAEQGKQVTLTTRREKLLDKVDFHNRRMLLMLMKDSPIRVLTNTWPQRIVADGLIAKQDQKEVTIPAETVVLSPGMHSCNELQAQLSGKVTNLFAIGDCVAPRLIINAIWEAYHTIKSIEQA